MRFRRLSVAFVATALIVAAVFSIIQNRSFIAEQVVVSLVRPVWKDVVIQGVSARVYLPDSYVPGSRGNRAVLFMHGNGETHAQFLGKETLESLKTGHRIFAVIDGQDETQPPFSSAASGWGNSIYRQRYVALYQYLLENFGIEPTVDVIGASMGGIAMGQFIVDQAIPINRAYGLGPVPSLQAIFANGGEKRRAPIRNAYGMKADGSQDSDLGIFARGALWVADLKKPPSLPELKIIAGSGDSVFSDEFGGAPAYDALCAAYDAAGGACYFQDVAGFSHADPRLLPTILAWIEIPGYDLAN